MPILLKNLIYEATNPSSSDDLSGWITPTGEFIEAVRNHQSALRGANIDLTPVQAVELGYVWINDEGGDSITIELIPSKFGYVMRWLKNHLDPNRVKTVTLHIFPPNAPPKIRTISTRELTENIITEIAPIKSYIGMWVSGDNDFLPLFVSNLSQMEKLITDSVEISMKEFMNNVSLPEKLSKSIEEDPDAFRPGYNSHYEIIWLYQFEKDLYYFFE